MVDATWPPCSPPRRHSRARGNRESRGGRTPRTRHARATSNQAFVDVIIARKRAPSHRVFVAQVCSVEICVANGEEGIASRPFGYFGNRIEFRLSSRSGSFGLVKSSGLVLVFLFVVPGPDWLLFSCFWSLLVFWCFHLGLVFPSWSGVPVVGPSCGLSVGAQVGAGRW